MTTYNTLTINNIEKKIYFESSLENKKKKLSDFMKDIIIGKLIDDLGDQQPFTRDEVHQFFSYHKNKLDNMIYALENKYKNDEFKYILDIMYPNHIDQEYLNTDFIDNFDAMVEILYDFIDEYINTNRNMARIEIWQELK